MHPDTMHHMPFTDAPYSLLWHGAVLQPRDLEQQQRTSQTAKSFNESLLTQTSSGDKAHIHHTRLSIQTRNVQLRTCPVAIPALARAP